MRYGVLHRAVRAVSDKMLIQRLWELEADGVVKRTDDKEIPSRVDYSLVPLGLSLAQALVPLCTWGRTTWPRSRVSSLSGRDGGAREGERGHALALRGSGRRAHRAVIRPFASRQTSRRTSAEF
ncbi:MAG: winged helix-turn-helix transcriptional regulator [Phreatobacter sp.]